MEMLCSVSCRTRMSPCRHLPQRNTTTFPCTTKPQAWASGPSTIYTRPRTEAPQGPPAAGPRESESSMCITKTRAAEKASCARSEAQRCVKALCARALSSHAPHTQQEVPLLPPALKTETLKLSRAKGAALGCTPRRCTHTHTTQVPQT